MCKKRKKIKEIEVKEELLPAVSDVIEDKLKKNDEDLVEKNNDVPDSVSEEEKADKEEQYIKEKLDGAEQTVKKASQKKKKIINLVFFLVNIGVVAGILMYQLWGVGDGFVPLSGLNLKAIPFILIFVVFILCMVFDTLVISYLVKKDTGKSQFAICFKTANIGRYYDDITPLATGGQPFEVAYLKKHGVSAAASLSIPIAKSIFQQFGLFILSLVGLITSFITPGFDTFVSVTSIVGFVLSFSVLFITIFLSISKKIGKKLVVGSLKLLKKMKIIKNYEKQYQRVTNYVESFQSIMQQYAKSPKDFIILFTTTFTRLLLYYTVPFLIYCCFNEFDISLLYKLFIMGVLVELSASFFPLPGGTGMNEISFSAMLQPYLSTGQLFWGLLFWRSFTYYGNILVGLIILCYDFAYGDRKFRWKKKQLELQEESKVFKQTQIQKFRKERDIRRKRMSKAKA